MTPLPRRWPVRWRLAFASAALTAVILIAFALVVGRLASNRIRADFDEELQNAAGSLALQVQIEEASGLGPIVRGPRLQDFAMPNDAAVRVVGPTGEVIAGTPDAPDLGPPASGRFTRAGQLHVATVAVSGDRLGTPPAFVQYGRNPEDVEATIDRLWFFLFAGVLGGTLLATLAGLMLADRAMRPIASLTAAAREIAETRDPSRRIPETHADDEVAELARTLEQMLRSLDAARGETQQAMQRQREFVADASHELRTPLTSVLANLELLQASLERRGESGEPAEIVSSALRSSRRMKGLVADLLLLARADSGRLGERRPSDLTAVAREALSEVEPTAGDHEMVIESGGPVVVEGNADELHRMLVNLLDNAVRHTPAGTTVTIRVAEEGGEAVLEVFDDGPGIPPELADHVFERFVRGEGPADTARGGGTGLGLAIVRAVADSHDGRVTLSSDNGKGARFTVRLPLAQRQAAKEELRAV